MTTRCGQAYRASISQQSCLAQGRWGELKGLCMPPPLSPLTEQVQSLRSALRTAEAGVAAAQADVAAGQQRDAANAASMASLMAQLGDLRSQVDAAAR